MVIYKLVVLLYGFVIRVASVKSWKAKHWVLGRKDWRTVYTKKISKLNAKGDKKNIWVHCASYGEFEQGRPLIESIKKQHPSYNIILTFFSPSGYEAFKDWKGAEVICYLPLDTKQNARDFINIVNPQTVIFIKYEFWLYFLYELKRLNIKTYLVSAVFKPHHPFFKWYGGIYRRSLLTFNKLFIQDVNSGKLLDSINIKNYEVFGDTRFDRVLEVKSKQQKIQYFENFCANSKIIIAGSTWPQDDELLLEAFKKLNTKNVKLIIVPHEVDQNSIEDLVTLLSKKELSFSLYSDNKPDNEKQVLIVNAMGLLSKIYYYADVAYIGGGFDEGIHNCLEPAVYFKPVVFYGDGFSKYNEAVELINLQAAVNVMNEEETITAFNRFLTGSEKGKLEEKLENYFEKKSGTTKKVLATLNLH